MRSPATLSAPGSLRYSSSVMGCNSVANAIGLQVANATGAFATVAPMPKAPDQGWRRERLRALAEHVDFGGKAGLGRALGYKDGAFVGQMLNGLRPIVELSRPQRRPETEKEDHAPE